MLTQIVEMVQFVGWMVFLLMVLFSLTLYIKNR